MRENKTKWDKRQEEESNKKGTQNEKLKENWTKQERLRKAERKKKELLERIKSRKSLAKISLEWSQDKKKMWRRYREKNCITVEVEKEIEQALIQEVSGRTALPKTANLNLILAAPKHIAANKKSFKQLLLKILKLGKLVRKRRLQEIKKRWHRG